MAFTVSQRTREIGVRVALGAGLVMFTVCTLACSVPVRRALSVQPTEALGTEG